MLQVVIVANPANTNALILKENAPSIPAKNITALTRLDHNRALGQVSPTCVLCPAAHSLQAAEHQACMPHAASTRAQSGSLHHELVAVCAGSVNAPIPASVFCAAAGV